MKNYILFQLLCYYQMVIKMIDETKDNETPQRRFHPSMRGLLKAGIYVTGFGLMVVGAYELIFGISDILDGSYRIAEQVQNMPWEHLQCFDTALAGERVITGDSLANLANELYALGDYLRSMGGVAHRYQAIDVMQAADQINLIVPGGSCFDTHDLVGKVIETAVDDLGGTLWDNCYQMIRGAAASLAAQCCYYTGGKVRIKKSLDKAVSDEG
jgi:hypothetical protein